MLIFTLQDKKINKPQETCDNVHHIARDVEEVANQA